MNEMNGRSLSRTQLAIRGDMLSDAKISIKISNVACNLILFACDLLACCGAISVPIDEGTERQT